MKINKPKIITYQEKIFEEIEIDEQYNNYKFTKIDMYILAVYTFIKSMYFCVIRHKLKIKNIQFR